MRTLASLTKDELEQASFAHVRENGGHIESVYAYAEVAKRLDASIYDAESVGTRTGMHREYQSAVNRFSSRVRGALDRLVVQGQLIKIGARGVLPNGYHAGQSAHYYTPEAYQAAVQERDAARAAMSELADRWAGISRRLMDATGFTLDNRNQLDAEHWERLLDKAGW